LQKRPIILSILLTIATPQVPIGACVCREDVMQTDINYLDLGVFSLSYVLVYVMRTDTHHVAVGLYTSTYEKERPGGTHTRTHIHTPSRS